MDLHKRSWAKSITWRLIGVVILGFITYVITHDLGQTTVITLIFHGLRLVLYYFHERLWERISWGRWKHPLSDISVREDLTQEDLEEIRILLDRQQYLANPPEYEI